MSKRSDSRPATIYDVAREAGVSHQTVSRLLSGFAGIKPATRERVEAALKRLDYRPNQAARLLRTQRSNRIGALAHEMDKSGPGRVIYGASFGAREAGYVLDILPMDDFDPTSIAEAVKLLTHEQVSGIFATAQTDRVKEALEALPLTVPIFIDSRLGDDTRADPTAKSIQSGRVAARHLLDLGHRDIGYVSGPMDWLAARDRRSGALDEITTSGGNLVDLGVGDWSPESGYRLGLDLDPLVITAVCLANDDMAIGLLRALYERGIEVPGQLSVIGFDDIPEARYLVPALTTIRIDFEADGRTAIRWLIDEIEGRKHPGLDRSLPELVVRDSTAPPSSID